MADRYKLLDKHIFCRTDKLYGRKLTGFEEVKLVVRVGDMAIIESNGNKATVPYKNLKKL